ncbi:hypothetical protein DPMN_187390 [Dreissena polymorpha]|uniref:Uncharacterized protein n=1 Tax=Dreissena polymorpha TaxID=45954 RepID=A0A9D4DS11_DREPO|nr:hypothetical protein DPMN_187390 [Dreissena polymorpha]
METMRQCDNKMTTVRQYDGDRAIYCQNAWWRVTDGLSTFAYDVIVTRIVYKWLTINSAFIQTTGVTS